MNKAKFKITGIVQELGIGNNHDAQFDWYESIPPIVGSSIYARSLGAGVRVTKVEPLDKNDGYMNVMELTKEQKEELKWNLYYKLYNSDENDEEDMKLLQRISSPNDITDEDLEKRYEGVSFVNEDFGCSCGH